MAELWEQNWSRLPLAVAVNTRELGGYPTKDGGSTKYHRFIRSGVLSFSPPEELEFLYKYGVRCQIDLRGQTEHEGDPDPKVGPDVEMHHFPLYEVNLADLSEVDLHAVYGGDPTICEVYREILDKSKENIGRVFKTMAAAPDGVILFYCTVGKDRTGIIAFLLLMLAGCDEYDCIVNYMPSATNLRRWPIIREMWADPSYSDNRRGNLDSSFDSGEFLYHVIEDELGGVENYLKSAGVTAEELEAVRQRLVG